MEAFLAFYKDERSIVQSLLESLSDPITVRAVFEVLAKGELFLDNLYFLEGSTFYKIYDSAIEAAKRLEANESYSQLLVSKAFAEACWGPEGSTTQLLCRAKETAESSAPPLVSKSEPQGKRLCYLGINYLASSKTEEGVQYLREALQLMHGCPDLAVLRLVALQILSHFSQIQNDIVEKECKAVGDTDLISISSRKSKERETEVEENQTDSSIISNHPLRWQVLDLVSNATKNFVDTGTKQHLRNISHKMLKEIEIEKRVSSGLFRFHRNVITALFTTSGDTKMLLERRISYHQTALT